MSVANLQLRTLSPPGLHRPKLGAVLVDWEPEGVWMALCSEAQTEPVKGFPPLETK